MEEKKRGEKKPGKPFSPLFSLSSFNLQCYISFNLKAFLSALLSPSLTWLFPFNDLQDTYCVFSFRLNFIGKKNTPVSTDLMQEGKCEMLLGNPAVQACSNSPEGLETLSRPLHAARARSVQTDTHTPARTHDNIHVILKKK